VGAKQVLKAKRVIVVLVICLAAAMAVRFAHSSAAWQHVLMFTAGLQWWPSVEAANTASLIVEGLLTALLGGAFTTLLALSTRLPTVAAAAILSAAVFMGINDIPLFGELDNVSAAFLAGYVKLTLAFFLSGWLIAAIVLKLFPGKGARPD
jgi:hypothetical protein